MYSAHCVCLKKKIVGWMIKVMKYPQIMKHTFWGSNGIVDSIKIIQPFLAHAKKSLKFSKSGIWNIIVCLDRSIFCTYREMLCEYKNRLDSYIIQWCNKIHSDRTCTSIKALLGMWQY